MKSLREFLSEELVPYSAFSLPRSQMPQLKNIKHFINYVEQLGVSVKELTDTMDLYEPTQVEFDEWKVNNIKMDWRKNPDSIASTKPIIVSDDNFVLDGHHRYFASKQTGEELNIIKIALPINKLLKLALDYRDLHG